MTQREIAKALGLSQITVSRVLNNSPLVTPETRQRVLELIEQSGYALNRNARNLVAGRKGALAVVFPGVESMAGAYFLPTLMGISEAVNARQYHIQTLCPEAAESPEATLAGLRGQVDGVLLFNIGGRGRENLADCLRRHNFPHVLIQYYSGSDSPYVTIDNELGGVLAARHLCGLGHRRLVYLGACGESSENTARREGFVRGCREVGVHLSARQLITPPTDDPTSLVAEWLAAPVDRRPTAVFTYSDRLARLVVFAVQARGGLVPRDLSVVGFDDARAYSLMVAPHLTTVRQTFRELGIEAVRKVLAGGEEAGVIPTAVAPELMVRGSSAPPAPEAAI